MGKLGETEINMFLIDSTFQAFYLAGLNGTIFCCRLYFEVLERLCGIFNVV